MAAVYVEVVQNQELETSVFRTASVVGPSTADSFSTTVSIGKISPGGGVGPAHGTKSPRSSEP